MKLTGKVIEGKGYGRKIGFPTANIDRDDYLKKKCFLKYGIYGGFVTLQDTGETLLSGIVIGPEDENGIPKLEAHLIDYIGDLYGRMITLNILEFIRPFVQYGEEKKLKEAISKDIKTIKNLNLSPNEEPT